MSTPPSTPARPWFSPSVWLLPHLTVYHLTVASVLAIASAGFAVLIAVLIIIAQNFNVLGWTE